MIMAYMQELIEIFSSIFWESVYQYLELLGLHTDTDDSSFQNMTIKDDSKIFFQIYLLVPFEMQWRFLKENSVCILLRLTCFKDNGKGFKTFGHGEKEFLPYSNFKTISNCSSEQLPDSSPAKDSMLNLMSMQNNYVIYYVGTPNRFPETGHGDATDEGNETNSESQSGATMNANSLEVAEMDIMEDISEETGSIDNSSDTVKGNKNQTASYQQDEVSSSAKSSQCSSKRKMDTKVAVEYSTSKSIKTNPVAENETEVSSKPVGDNFLLKDNQNGCDSLLERRVSAVVSQLLNIYPFCTCPEIGNLISRLNNFQPHLKEVKYTELISMLFEVIEECLKNYTSVFSDTNQRDKTIQHIQPFSYSNSSNSDEMLDEKTSHTSVSDPQFAFTQILEDTIKEIRNSMPSAEDKVFKESKAVNADSVEMNALNERILNVNVTDHEVLPRFSDRSQITPNKQDEISSSARRSFQSNFKRKRDYELSPIKKHLSFESPELLEMKSTNTQVPESLVVGTQTDIHSETIMAKDSFSEENPMGRNFLETHISMILSEILNISHFPSICPPDQIEGIVSMFVEIQNDFGSKFVDFHLEKNNFTETISTMFETLEQCLNELSNIISRIVQMHKTGQQRQFLISYAVKSQRVAFTQTNYYYDPNDDLRTTLVRILNTTLKNVKIFRSRADYVMETLTSLSISESQNSVVNCVIGAESLNVDNSGKCNEKKFKSLWQEKFASENKVNYLTTQECDSTSDPNVEECNSLGYPREKEIVLSDHECESSPVPTKVNGSAITVTQLPSSQSNKCMVDDNTYGNGLQPLSQTANCKNIKSHDKKICSDSSVSSMVDSQCESSSKVHFRGYSYTLYPGPFQDPEKVKKDHRFQKKFYKQSRESKENIGKEIIKGKQSDQPEFVSRTLPLREHFQSIRSSDKECFPNPSNFTTSNTHCTSSSKGYSYTLYPGPITDPENLKKDDRFRKKFYKQSRESKENIGKKMLKGKQNDQPELVSRMLLLCESFENISPDKECHRNPFNFTTLNIQCASSSTQPCKTLDYKPYPGLSPDLTKVEKDYRYKKSFHRQNREKQKALLERENLNAGNYSKFGCSPNNSLVPQLLMSSMCDYLENFTDLFSSKAACSETVYNSDKSIPSSYKTHPKTKTSPKNETHTADECITFQTKVVDESSSDINLRTDYSATVYPLSHEYGTENLDVLFCRNSSDNNLGISYNNRIPLRPALKVINYDIEMIQDETSVEEFLAASRNLVEVYKGMTDKEGFFYTLKVPVIPIKDESNRIPKKTTNPDDTAENERRR